MPVLPVYESNARAGEGRLEIGNAPDLARSSASFQAAQDVAQSDAQTGNALSRFGGITSDLASHMAMREEQQNKFAVGVQAAGLQTDAVGTLQQMQQRILADGTYKDGDEPPVPFSQAASSTLDKVAKARFDQMPEGRARDEAIATWDAQRGHYIQQANKIELGQRQSDVKYKVGTTLDDLATHVQNTPSKEYAAGAIAQINKLIDDSPWIPDAEKRTMKDQASEKLAMVLARTAFATNGAGAAKALAVPDPGAPQATGLGRINIVYQGDVNAAAPGMPSPSAMMNYLVSKGATRNEALMLTSAAASESGLNPNATHDGNIGYGLFGHNQDRLAAMRAASGSERPDWQQQALFALKELRSRPEAAAVNDAQTPEELTDAQMRFERPQGYTDANPRGGHNYSGRLGTLRRFASMNADDSKSVGGMTPGDPFFVDNISFAARQSIVNEASKADTRNRQALGQLVKDDESSIATTGKPIDALTPDVVEKMYGPDAAQAFLDNRRQAMRYYSATHDLELVPNDQIAARVEQVAPIGGTAGFDNQARYYNDAQRRAADVLRKRAADPAAAVAVDPAVATAKGQVNAGQPETYAALVKARLTAQAALGIPEAQRQVITKEEATAWLAPVVNALPSTERAALQKVVPAFKAAFGDYSDRALMFALEQAKIDTDTAQAASTMFRKIGLGEKPSVSDQADLGRAQTNDAMKNAAGGTATQDSRWPGVGALFDKKRIEEKGFYSTLGEVSGAGRVVGAVGSGISSVGGRIADAGSYVWYGDRSGPDMQNSRPPDAAIVALIQNPSKADDFDAMFGKGMAAKVLKEHGAMNAKPDAPASVQEGRSASKGGGSLDASNRPAFASDNQEGDVEPIVVDDNGKWVVVPSMRYNDKGQKADVLNEDQAVSQYEKTGQHFGRFKTREEAFRRLEAIKRDNEFRAQ